MFQKTAKDVHRAIELWANEQKSETTSDPVAVATTFRDNYERIGADTPPCGNTFCKSARRRQDERVAAVARLPSQSIRDAIVKCTNLRSERYRGRQMPTSRCSVGI